MQPPESACLVIADISGYTGYLAGVELDHAQDILADLMQVVVSGLRPPFRLAKLEGDAAFVFVPAEKVDGSVLQDSVESTYFAFRRRLRDIRQSTTCECNACILIPRLDLKFVVHHGMIAHQKMAGRDELVGRDVILVHRLLKNGVDKVVGSHAYALYTDACLKVMGVDPVEQGLTGHSESIDIIGEVRAWVRDLELVWQEAEAATLNAVTPETAWHTFTFEADAPRPLVWSFLTNPAIRPQWQTGVTEVKTVAMSRGRRRAGATNHCMHGKDATIEEVLDWRPNELVTLLTTTGGLPGFVMTDVLSDLPEGRTRLDVHIGKPKPKDREALAAAMPFLEQVLSSGLATMKPLVAEEAARRARLAAADPALPQSAARYTLPVEASGSQANHSHPHDGPHAH